MKPHYKAIVLLIASEDSANDCYILKKIKPEWKPVFPFFKAVHEQYINTNKDIRAFYVYGNTQVSRPSEHDLIFSNIPETNHPGILLKTVAALEYLSENFTYDYVIRTNLSTFWDLNKLLNRLDTLPASNCVRGTPMSLAVDSTRYNFISGFDLVLSKDVVQVIIDNKQELVTQQVYINLEDLSICDIISKYTKHKFDTPEILHLADDAQILELVDKTVVSIKNTGRVFDHYRVKNRFDRQTDKLLMQKLLLEIYGKTL
jgi:hypothetical protein